MRHQRVWRTCVILVGALGTFGDAQSWTSYTAVPRWGQASALLGKPPTLLVHGGKTGSGATFTSAPNTADLLALDLSTSFSTSSVPWRIDAAETVQPEVAFHTLSPLSVATSSHLLFGGDETGVALPSANDSAWLLTLSTPFSSAAATVWTDQPAGWASQPQRRIDHTATAVTTGQQTNVWVFGGQRDDGSGIANNEIWLLTTQTASVSTSAQWSPVTATGNSPLPTWGHTATWLDDQIVILGGVGYTAGANSLNSMSTIYVLTPSTTSAAGAWTQLTPSGTVPAARRGHVAVALDASRLLIHGGASIDGTTCYNDAWILTISGTSASWQSISYSSGTAPSARYSHTAAYANNLLVVTLGYAATGPADAGVYIFDPSTSAWVTSFTAATAAASTTASASQTSGTAATSATAAAAAAVTVSSHAVPASSALQSASSVAAGGTMATPASASTVSTFAGSSSPKTYIIAGSVAGTLALVALGVGGLVYSRRRTRSRYRSRQPYGRPSMGSDGFAPVEKAVPVRQPWRRFDMLEDEEAVWTGRSAEQRAREFQDAELHVDHAGTLLVSTYRPDPEPSLFDDGQRTPRQSAGHFTNEPPSELAYNTPMTENEPIMVSRSNAFSPSASLYGSTFSPTQSTNQIYHPPRRSDTWWSRFAANAGLVRQTPTHNEPIRDPMPGPGSADDPDEWGIASSRPRQLHPPSLQAINEFGGPEGDAAEGDGLLGREKESIDSLVSASSSHLEEKIRTFDIVQRGPRPYDTSDASGTDEEEGPFGDGDRTPQRGGATPGSVVWRGNDVFSPTPSVPPVPANLQSPSSVYAPTPALGASAQSVRSASSGVRRMVADYERRQSISEDAIPMPTSPRKAAQLQHGFAKKPKLFVTNN